MDAPLRAAIDLVLVDLAATCAVQPRVDERAGVVWFWEADGTGCGVNAPAGMTPAETAVTVADQASDWAVEALNHLGLSATWPECPLHPGTHPLAAEAKAGVAIWRCAKSDQVIAEIGTLPPHSSSRRAGLAAKGRRGR